MGQIDSALSDWFEVWEESAARACAACVGEEGDDAPDNEPAAASSRRLRLMASAWRLGGPLLRLGLSNVHGMSSAAHALHGGPDSSHCDHK